MKETSRKLRVVRGPIGRSVTNYFSCTKGGFIYVFLFDDHAQWDATRAWTAALAAAESADERPDISVFRRPYVDGPWSYAPTVMPPGGEASRGEAA